MLCTHERCSGRLTLSTPDRVTVLATLVCDDCGHEQGETIVCGTRDVPRLALASPR